jgi:hypothetical protein
LKKAVPACFILLLILLRLLCPLSEAKKEKARGFLGLEQSAVRAIGRRLAFEPALRWNDPG